MNASPKILVVLTSHAELGSTGKKTGFWLEELAAPYEELVRAGARVDLASPKGGEPPVDPGSVADPPEVARRFLADPEAVAKLASTTKLADVKVEDYDALFFAGGHGVMWDLASCDVTAKLVGRALDLGKVVGAVCHGPAALVAAKLANGEPVVRNRRVAAFSNEEERAVKLDGIVPFALESKLVELGATYERGPMWSSFAVRDGRLVTGQNPQSSVATAKEVLRALDVPA